MGFPFPLNAFVYVLEQEEGAVRSLHYGVFAQPGESLPMAQERATDVLLQHLPPPPARVLDVGCGTGATLERLRQAGYRAQGLAPEKGQSRTSVHVGRFESFWALRGYEVLLFQESSQYIDSRTLFAQARKLGSRCVLVMDEFAMEPGHPLRTLDAFVAAAGAHGFEVAEMLDFSQQAAPTVDYFLERLPRYAAGLHSELGVTREQLKELLDSGERYRENYAQGRYAYRLLRLGRT